MDDRSPLEIIETARSLARKLYARMGCAVPAGYRFEDATHPQERLCWQMACDAFETIDGTEIAEVLEEIEDA